MGRGKSDTFNPIHPADKVKQISKGDLPMMTGIGINILAQQGNLTNPGTCQHLNFFYNGKWIPTFFLSPDIGYHTIGAKIFTPLHDGYKS